jgi:ribosome maturation factor RimP
MSLKDKLLGLIEKYLNDTIYELVDLTYQKEGFTFVLRILIDKPEGIGLEDCSIVSKGISPILDENEESLGLVDNYSLEVSSPGVNRPLVKLIDFDRFKENDVKVILKSPDKSIDENRIRFKGYLKGIEEDKVILIVDEKELLIDYNSIKKANLVYKF